MRVNYTEVRGLGSFNWYPFLHARISGAAGSAVLPMLVDSGASESVAPRSFLEALGIVVDGEAVELGSFLGEVLVGQACMARIAFGALGYTGRIVAVPDDTAATAILGQRDFFLNFWVAFDSANRMFSIAPARRH